MIIDIRGASGSGKTWVVRKLLSRFAKGVKEIHEIVPGQGRGKPVLIGYEVPQLKAAIIGPYRDTANTGGCDSIKTPEEVCRRIRLFNERYKHVILEGLLVGKCFQRYADLADELGRKRYCFCFLDTPSEVSLERIHTRRLKTGNDKPFNPKNFWVDYRAGISARTKLIAGNYTHVMLPHKNPLPPIFKLLGK